jgi:hypothetical protein
MMGSMIMPDSPTMPPASPIKAFLKLPEIAQLSNRRHLELVQCFVKPPQATSPAIQRAFVHLEESEEAHKCKNFLNAAHFSIVSANSCWI